MKMLQVQVASDKLAELCQARGVARLSLFGSVLTDCFSDSSDIDVLVEFQPERRVGYLAMAALERELSSIFGGRKVDLRTPNELSPYFRDEVISHASVQYAAV
ncbi:MAG TPA: nucleotidyltransferase domain-containing protein [Bryobacteraceae bacterium]|nr:nucleotidyltransferase domain-containing protein [Bryobacteraceae bacterium]